MALYGTANCKVSEATQNPPIKATRKKKAECIELGNTSSMKPSH